MAALFRVKALYEYSSPHEDDLNFPAGQVIAVTDEDDADWYGGEYVDESGAKKAGIFPRNFVEKFEPVAPPRPVRKHKQEPEAAAPAPPPPEASAPDHT
ncbi:myosin tail region-interacting mti1, partial [Trichoderma arundinaceum]